METIPGGYEDLIELEAVGRSHRAVRFDMTHGDREDLEAQHYHEPKQRNSWSSSTQRVLSSMPSRSIRWNQTAVLSQNQSRSTKTRRRRRAPKPVSTTFSAANRDVFRERKTCADDVTQDEELLNKLQDLPAGESVRLLREMPLSVSKKREIRALCFSWELAQPLSENEALFCHRFQACFLKVLCGCWLGGLSQKKSIQLWQKVFKNISARFGTGILSYFIFLRRLLLYNILFLLINGLFLLLPQISNPQISNPQIPDPSPRSPSEDEHTYLWMLTGTGYLTDSVMFYGHYTNSTRANCQAKATECSHYNIPLAYIFTIGTGMFVTCVMLVYRMSKSFEKSFCTFKATGNLALKVFCSWDFKVCRKRSVKLQAVNICTQLKEMLSELSCRKKKRNLCSTLGWLSVHLLVWSICLLCIGACMMAVYYIHPYLEQGGSMPIQENYPVHLLAMPLVVSCISHLLPGFFDKLSKGEDYNSPSVHIYVSIVRNLLLKGCIFCMLCYYWHTKIDDAEKGQKCWETFVGQELYRLVLMDLIVAVLHIILAEFLWGMCIRNFTFRRRKLEFDIARDVLELIYDKFDDELPSAQETLEGHSDEHCLRQPPVFTILHWGPNVCHIYDVEDQALLTLWALQEPPQHAPLRQAVDRGSGRLEFQSEMAQLRVSSLGGQPFVPLHFGRPVPEGEDKKFLIAKLQALNEASALSREVSIWAFL
ncbi:unnamed protein product [Leuciscus chuanchicus]